VAIGDGCNLDEILNRIDGKSKPYFPFKLTLGWPCPEKDFNNPKSLWKFHFWKGQNLLS
jgi:hypothetical protein